MNRSQQLSAMRRFVMAGEPLPADLGGVRPSDAALIAAEALLVQYRRLQAWAQEGKRYASLSPMERAAWQFAHPAGLTFPGPSQLDDARRRAEAAIDDYVNRWAPGWTIPHGYMECDGRRPGGGEGPHLRRLKSIVINDDELGRERGRLEPELQEGEELVETCGSMVPIIIQGRLPSRYREEEDELFDPGDRW